MDVNKIITKFDKFLVEQEYTFSGVVIGGAALIIMDISLRATKDIDFLDPELEKEFLELANTFREKYPKLNLQEDWINNGPITLRRDLPFNWENRLVEIFKGEALILRTLGQADLLKSKLFAYCDRDIDLQDCIDLSPSNDELDEALEWLTERDGNPLWPERVKAQIDYLKERLNE